MQSKVKFILNPEYRQRSKSLKSCVTIIMHTVPRSLAAGGLYCLNRFAANKKQIEAVALLPGDNLKEGMDSNKYFAQLHKVAEAFIMAWHTIFYFRFISFLIRQYQ